MEYFFESSDTIEKGHGFSHYDGLHLSWLFFFVLVTVACCFSYKRLSEKGRRVMRYVFAALLLLDEAMKVVGLASHGNWTVDYLPLHLCSVSLILSIVHAIKPNDTVGEFLYTIGIPGALAALLFPTWTKLPLLNFMHLHSFTVHILLVVYPAMLTFAGEIRPRLRRLPKVLALLGGFALVALVVNLITKDMAVSTNFMFLMSASKGNPLYLFEEAFGNHLYGYPVLITAVLLVMYAPWLIYEAIKKKKAS
ncbi:MAG: YwaF family protein [Clostridia bacterium]|nr:YwaF family protein [Clostridia bacterium]